MGRVAKKELLEAEELDVTAQDRDFIIPSDGPARVVDDSPIQIIDGPRALNYQDKAAALAFMEEKVVVHITEDTNPNAENPVQLGVNGRMIVLWRGFDYIVARKYLEKLARCKTTRIKTVPCEIEGIKSYKNERKTAFTYPFRVVRDDNPLGDGWLRKVSAEQ